MCVISDKEEAVLVRGVKTIINPRRACAARVTVVVLCVCQSVCLFVRLSATILALQARGGYIAIERQ